MNSVTFNALPLNHRVMFAPLHQITLSLVLMAGRHETQKFDVKTVGSKLLKSSLRPNADLAGIVSRLQHFFACPMMLLQFMMLLFSSVAFFHCSKTRENSIIVLSSKRLLGRRSLILCKWRSL